jgi:Ca-activated chloride channel family protein
MNPNKISPDDPRLTAYALGEMEAAERNEFEQSIAGDADAQQAVAEIRRAGRALEDALATETVPELVAPAAGAKLNREFNGKVVTFPHWLVGLAAAACFAVVFTYTQIEHANRPLVVQPEAAGATGKAAGAQPADSGATRVVEVQLAPPQPEADQAVAAQAKAAEMRAVGSERQQPPGLQNRIASERSRGQRPPVPASAPGDVVALDKVEVTESSLSLPKAEAAAAPILPVPQPQAPMMGQLAGSDLSAAGMISQVQGSVANGRGGASGQELINLQPFMVTGGRAPTGVTQDFRAPALSDAAGRTRHMGLQSNDFFREERKGSLNTEAYAYVKDNDFLRVRGNELSTFSIDVDTAAYTNVRRFLHARSRPPRDAVRIEELVNYFPYQYTPPTGAAPFAASLEVAGAPWKPQHRLVRIGLKGREVSDAARPAANLVFLIDVSGSMQAPNKLPLVKQSLRMLVEKLRADDRVAIAVYAGASGLALPSTPAARKTEILAAIDQLEAGGSTNGAAGIHLAYDVAKANFLTGGVNRVVLATDGDFNVGVTSEGELTRLIEEKAKSGVFLSVLGFGMGNYKDATLERLADKGNGNYAYIDTEKEARKALVEQAGGTLVTIAKDVKIQVEFNPAVVQAYRLIGYENRLLAKEDFNNDKVDAGEIGAGHTVTALYEVVPVGVPMPETGGEVDPLKYEKPAERTRKSESRIQTSKSAEMLTVKVRYKEPAGDVSSKLEFPLVDSGRAFAEASVDFKFAAAVASFGMILRESPHRGVTDFAQVAAWAREGTGSDAGGYRGEFLGLVEQAKAAFSE